jgi:hypothetical protein
MPHRTEQEVRQECTDNLPTHRYNEDAGHWEIYSALLGWMKPLTPGWTPESSVEQCVQKWRDEVKDIEDDKDDIGWPGDLNPEPIPPPPTTPPANPQPEDWVPSKDFWIGAVNFANEWIGDYDGHLTGAEVHTRAKRWVDYVYANKPLTSDARKEFKAWYEANIGAWPGGGPVIFRQSGGLNLVDSWGAGHTEWDNASRAATLFVNALSHEYRILAVQRYASERRAAGWLPSGTWGNVYHTNYGFELYLTDPNGYDGTHRPFQGQPVGKYSEFTAADMYYVPEQGYPGVPNPGDPPPPDVPPGEKEPPPDEDDGSGSKPPVIDDPIGGGSGSRPDSPVQKPEYNDEDLIRGVLGITDIVNHPSEVPATPDERGQVIWVRSTGEIYVGQEDGTWEIFKVSDINPEAWGKIPHHSIPNAYWDIPLIERQGDRTTFYWELATGHHIVSGGWDIYVNIPLDTFKAMTEDALLEFMKERMGPAWVDHIETELVLLIYGDTRWPLPESFIPISKHEIRGNVGAGFYISRATTQPDGVPDRWVDMQG